MQVIHTDQPDGTTASGETITLHRDVLSVCGLEYVRSSYSYGRPSDAYHTFEHDHFALIDSQQQKYPDAPAVRCGSCHGTTFTLFMGSYEVLAQCSNCGKKAVVYSG
jgi:hypothetical protein